MLEGEIHESISKNKKYTSVIDVTYGLLIEHAKEDLENIKSDSWKIPFILEKYIPWLVFDIERLKKEKEEGIYKDLVSDQKLVNIIETMENLLFKYRVEEEKFSLVSAQKRLECLSIKNQSNVKS